MSHDLKECPDCLTRFPTKYAEQVHICPASPKESDDQIMAFLKGLPQRKEGENE